LFNDALFMLAFCACFIISGKIEPISQFNNTPLSQASTGQSYIFTPHLPIGSILTLMTVCVEHKREDY